MLLQKLKNYKPKKRRSLFLYQPVSLIPAEMLEIDWYLNWFKMLTHFVTGACTDIVHIGGTGQYGTVSTTLGQMLLSKLWTSTQYPLILHFCIIHT